jgi:diacylglycerol kinase (ATP)
VRDLAEKLMAAGIKVDVKVKIKKKRAARDARRAAKGGYPLVIAAGGDGTVEAVARGLVGTPAALGIIPLGTYNNVATCLGIPTDVDEAIALIATGPTRAIDVGMVLARGMKKPLPFLEMAGVGLLAALMPVGQDVEKGRWQSGAHALPVALNMTPTQTQLRLDGAGEKREQQTLLVEVINAPRNGPGLIVNGDARMDDGLLDVQVYEGMDQPALARRFLALKLGMTPDDTNVEHMRTSRLEVQTASPLPVVADSKVVGTTPARFDVLPGALLVVSGRGIGLAHPVAPTLVQATVERTVPQLVAAARKEEEDGAPDPNVQQAATPVAAHRALVTSMAGAVAPLAAGSVKAGKQLRKAGVPAIAAAAGAAALPLFRLLMKRVGP